MNLGHANVLMITIDHETFRRVLLAFIATSSAMHYYYDGFIWKLRQPLVATDFAIRT